jgi:hypothetical protein
LSDVREGLAAAREKRRPAFDRAAPDGQAVDKDKSE